MIDTVRALIHAVTHEREFLRFCKQCLCAGSIAYFIPWPWSNPLFLIAIIAALTVYYFLFVAQLPKIRFANSDLTKRILQRIPSMKKKYYPSWWAVNPSLNSFYLLWGRPLPKQKPKLERELIPNFFSDGESATLQWCWSEKAEPGKKAPIIIYFHGLSNGTRESFNYYYMKILTEQGWHVVVPIRRGCGEPGTLCRHKQYAWGDKDDTFEIVEYIAKKMEGHPLIGFGISAGAVCMKNYLGQTGEKSKIKAAICLSSGYHGKNMAKFQNTHPLYSFAMCIALKDDILKRHADVLVHSPHSPIHKTFPGYDKINTITEYDQAITMRLFGFDNYEEFLDTQGCDSFDKIKVPLIILASEDDPIADFEWVPWDLLEKNPCIAAVTTSTGGHLGYAGGWWPFRECYTWLDYFLRDAVAAVLSEVQ